uniref:Uncharacterized protein n=1 Tax=Molossus molossus TaxID=27622 RepID=A0A7J8C962_MOLMO|nr:hypothetical protein HJG59_009992 [Molossus molossus]
MFASHTFLPPAVLASRWATCADPGRSPPRQPLLGSPSVCPATATGQGLSVRVCPHPHLCLLRSLLVASMKKFPCPAPALQGHSFYAKEEKPPVLSLCFAWCLNLTKSPLKTILSSPCRHVAVGDFSVSLPLPATPAITARLVLLQVLSSCDVSSCRQRPAGASGPPVYRAPLSDATPGGCRPSQLHRDSFSKHTARRARCLECVLMPLPA